HDGACDAGLIAFDANRKLVMSKRLKKFLPQTTVQQNFEALQAMHLPYQKMRRSRMRSFCVFIARKCSTNEAALLRRGSARANRVTNGFDANQHQTFRPLW